MALLNLKMHLFSVYFSESFPLPSEDKYVENNLGIIRKDAYSRIATKWKTPRKVINRNKNHTYTYTIFFYPEELKDFTVYISTIHSEKYTFVACNRSHLENQCILHNSKDRKRRALSRNAKTTTTLSKPPML